MLGNELQGNWQPVEQLNHFWVQGPLGLVLLGSLLGLLRLLGGFSFFFFYRSTPFGSGHVGVSDPAGILITAVSPLLGLFGLGSLG